MMTIMGSRAPFYTNQPHVFSHTSRKLLKQSMVPCEKIQIQIQSSAVTVTVTVTVSHILAAWARA